MWNIKTLVLIFLQKLFILWICVSFWLHGFCREWEGWARKLVNHTSWVAEVTLTYHPKLVCNCCVIELFCGVVCVVILPFWHFCWYRGFCHRTESDLFPFFLYVYIVHNWFSCISIATDCTHMVSQMGTLKGQDPEHNYSANCSKRWTLPKDGGQTKIKVCLRNTMPPPATESEKAIFITKVKVKVTRSLTLVSFDLGVICKGIISWVCMPNMKPLSLTIQKF